jgi:hypothetical protein
MTKRRKGNPEQDYNIISGVREIIRNVVLFSEGNEKVSLHKIIAIFSQGEIFQLLKSLKELGIFPGTRGHMNLEDYENLLTFFKKSKTNPALRDTNLKRWVADEVGLYCTYVPEFDC